MRKEIFKGLPDGKKGVEKMKCVQMLAQAGDFRHALDNLEKGIDNTLVDWEVIGISWLTENLRR